MLSNQTTKVNKSLDFSQYAPTNSYQLHLSHPLPADIPTFSSTAANPPPSITSLPQPLTSPVTQLNIKSLAALRPKITASPIPGSPSSNQTLVSSDNDSPKRVKKKRKPVKEDNSPELKPSPVVSPKRPRNRSVLDISIKVDKLVADLTEMKADFKTFKEEISLLSALLKPFVNNVAEIATLKTEVSKLRMDLMDRDEQIEHFEARLNAPYPDELSQHVSPPPINHSNSSSTHHYLNQALSYGSGTIAPQSIEELLGSMDAESLHFASGDINSHSFFNSTSVNEHTNGTAPSPTAASPLPDNNAPWLSPDRKGP